MYYLIKKTLTTREKLCRDNFKKAKAAATKAKEILNKILPDTMNQNQNKNRDPRALLNINFCLFLCNQMDKNSALPDIDIEEINNNFNTISEQLNKVTDNINNIMKTINNIHLHLNFLGMHNNVMSKIRQITVRAKSQLATLRQLYDMDRSRTPTYTIIKPEEISTLARTMNKTISKDINTFRLKLEIDDKDIYANIDIPLTDETRTATLILATPYPTFHKGKRYQVTNKDSYILINRNEMATKITLQECNTNTRTCKINKPLFLIKKNAPCEIKQVQWQNASCILKDAHEQQNFFRASDGFLTYAVNETERITITCHHDANTTSYEVLLRNRGQLNYPANCFIGNDNMLLMGKSYSSLIINTSTIFKEMNILDEEPYFNITNNIKLTNLNHTKLEAIDQIMYQPWWNFLSNPMMIIIMIGMILAITTIYLKFKQNHVNYPQQPTHRRGNSIELPQYPGERFREYSF